ncbi:unnamed protein product, partial [Meganyctiphanes norvegica]
PSGTYRNESGLVVFLNYIQFPDPKDYRHGAEKDRANVENAFKDLKYTVDYHENLSKSKTMAVLERIRKDNMLKFKDSLIIVINSHGKDRKTFLTSDGETHDIEKIKFLFTDTNCPAMKQKP